ncbi:MAG: hypothetical protein JWQ90_2526 [Hydrocarboniphaga sp.]|uniref:acyl-CoA thioesterase n=1 Tax=Hydrocarboniphaga sp. TaxID=2033016 RepID=UPI00262B736B|nr:acyl-CoA thioesterase domain-containing protein [Hydrocarboniphaga sp.]MDB5970076.1 hypothetical protein [Hydrocarboniphaga sp.]
MPVKTRFVDPSDQEDFLVDELSLTGGSDRYRRDISRYWAFGDDRVFGGYTAALALAAAAEAVKLPVLLSCQLQFLGATRVGEASIEVETLVRGRSAASVRVVLYQNAAPTVTLQCWLGESLPTPGNDLSEHSTPVPLACPQIRFRSELIPFMGVLDERAIDYPADDSGFQSGPPFVELWVRPRQVATKPSALLSQLFDVIAFDAHMLDSTRRARASTRIVTASLDLSVIWYSALPLAAWRRVRVESGPSHHGFAATSAVICDESGAKSASAFQQGRARAMSSR